MNKYKDTTLLRNYYNPQLTQNTESVKTSLVFVYNKSLKYLKHYCRISNHWGIMSFIIIVSSILSSDDTYKNKIYE